MVYGRPAGVASLMVMGEYPGRIYDETKRRPVYIGRDYFGIEASVE